jgi:2'-5' RNA ligase
VRLSWVPAANLHVTLRFHGEVADDQAEAAADALARAAAGIAPFTLRGKGLGMFPDAARPRVLWVGLTEGAAALSALAAAVEAESVRIGFPKEPRPFQPHLTLARIKAGNAGLMALIEAHAATELPASPVSEAVLYESRLHKTGAEYVAIRRVALGEASAIGAA